MRWKALLFALALLVGSLPAAPIGLAAPKPASDRVDTVVRRLAAEKPDGRVPVLIQRKNTQAGERALQTGGSKVRHRLKMANTVAAEIPASKLDELAADPDVLRVAYDVPMRSQAGTGSKFDPNAVLSAYPSVVGATRAWQNGIRGTGVTVAVLDSGIADNRSDFTGTKTASGYEYSSSVSRVIANVAVAAGASSPNDDNGHGTMVAGIIAGRGWADPATPTDDNQYVGVAPDARLVNVKVSDRNGNSQLSDVVAGIEWVIDNQATYNIQVMNLSLISSVPESYTTSILDAAVELAWFKGIVVVVSAGNFGPDTALYAPANDPFVITVGATDDNGTKSTSDDKLAWFSSYGKTLDGVSKPDLVAPGRRIVSVLSSKNDPLAMEFPAQVLNNFYIRLSGTSFAAPVVSGTVAELLQAARSMNLNLSPDQVKWLLTRTAHSVQGAGTGAGYPSLVDAGTYAYYHPSTIGRANAGIVPNNYLVLAYQSSTAGSTVDWQQVSWQQVSWQQVSWQQVSWQQVSWQQVSWQQVSWQQVSWQQVAGD